MTQVAQAKAEATAKKEKEEYAAAVKMQAVSRGRTVRRTK